MAQSPDQLAAAMIANMQAKTGKTLEQVADVDAEVRAWLEKAYAGA